MICNCQYCGGANLPSSIKDHEGFSGMPYEDSGKQAIGYGTLLPLTQYEAEWLMRTRLNDAVVGTMKLYDEVWDVLSEARKSVLCEMAYQMGVEGLAGFTELRKAVIAEDWERAYVEILDSKLAEQTPERAVDYAERMKRG